MEALWNKMELEHPPNNTWQASADEIDVDDFISTIDNVLKDLKSQDILHMEAAILSRLIYRMKSKFRNDKGVKNMEKVNKALLNYLNLKLHKEFEGLKDCIEPDGNLINLPTKQMLEYVLVRTQGFVKLMCRIENVARCAADFLKARISIGHAWTISVIAYAVISRIWVLSRHLVKRSCFWYKSIYQYLKKIKQIGVAWLPEDYNLPKDLEVWLDVPWIDEEIKRIPTKDDETETIFSLIGIQNQDSDDLQFDIEQIDETPKPVILSANVIEKKYKQNEALLNQKNELPMETIDACYSMDDVGRSIDRDVFKSELGVDVFGKQALAASPKKCKKLKIKKSDSLNKTNAKLSERKRKSLIKLDQSLSEMDVSKSDDINVEINTIGTLDKTNITRLKKMKKKLISLDQSDSGMFLSKGDTFEKLPKIRLTKEKTLPSRDHTFVSSSECEKQKHITPNDIKTRDDLKKFLSADSYPGLDRLQWNMLTKNVKKFVSKLNKCESSDTRKQRFFLKKAHQQIQNWIH